MSPLSCDQANEITQIGVLAWESGLDWLLALALLLIAFMAAVAGLLVSNALQGPVQRHSDSVFADAGRAGEVTGETIFLFDGETLLDATPGARQILAASRGKGAAWPRLLGYLTGHFHDVRAQLGRLAEEGQIVLSGKTAKGNPLLLTASLKGGLTRIALSDPAQGMQASGADALAFQALTEEVEDLRDVLAQAPVLIWREDTEGDVVWANAAYLLTAMTSLPGGRELGWPLPRLFERLATQGTARGQRAVLNDTDQGQSWFDLTGVQNDGERLMFALPADAAVNAESALRDFMQTLSKTFAQLPIGLAIFDRQRQLQLFNPALLDLTGLPPDFLSMRPSLLSVLDALRDRNMIPEPKDYRSWRRQLVEMEKAAASGLYEETWDLPDGQTFRVIGRPHPNGALALMIEDITSEVTRNRRYRLDLELGQAVIDEMEEAVAVFSSSGQFVMSNLAYATMWGHEPEGGLKPETVKAVAAHWRAQSAPATIWSEAEEFISTVGNRVSWRGEARLLDGRFLACRFVPLAGGATLAAFRTADVASVERPQVTVAESLKTA